jgi:hypothetical protein
LLKEGVGDGVGGNEGSSLRSVFRGDVTADRPRFEENQTIVILESYKQSFYTHRQRSYNVRDLTKWLMGGESGRLVFALGQINGDELEGYVLLLQHYCDAERARRGGESVEL